MKNIILMLLLLLFISAEIQSQVVTGRLVDENGIGLAEVEVQLYAPQNVYSAISDSDGTFYFYNVSAVEDSPLPTGYAVSNNFPNPFNPRTRIGITLPDRENIKVEVFNMLGQSVVDVIERTFDAGTNYVDVELNGLPNGFYISRITIDNKYTIVRKLMLIYGSQHLTTSGGVTNSQLNKPSNANFETPLDSLVATSSIIGRKTFTNLPNFGGGTLNLGNWTIERYCPGLITVLYEGKTYLTVQIGYQCWLKENLNIGTRIDGSQNQTNNSAIEKYCYNNDTANCTTYGGLYQWEEAMQYVTYEGAQGICPTGWHIPTLAEFDTLRAIVSDDGNALKAIEQGTGSGSGTNRSRFSALLAGYRQASSGYFHDLSINTYFWSSSEYPGNPPYYAANLFLYYNDSSIRLYYYEYKESGFSIRCLKD